MVLSRVMFGRKILGLVQLYLAPNPTISALMQSGDLYLSGGASQLFGEQQGMSCPGLWPPVGLRRVSAVLYRRVGSSADDGTTWVRYTVPQSSVSIINYTAVFNRNSKK